MYRSLGLQTRDLRYSLDIILKTAMPIRKRDSLTYSDGVSILSNLGKHDQAWTDQGDSTWYGSSC